MLTPSEKILLESNLGLDPVEVALRTGNRAVAEQVGVLAKAQTKLPSYYAARCYILPISYQQSTSEVVAQSRNFGTGGELAIDLTCGLGVDALHLSKHFTKVVTCEIDPERAEIAKHNFELLGCKNVEVRCCAAQELIESEEFPKADLIFCDPARRDAKGDKRHALEDCSPDIMKLMSAMLSTAKVIMVKLSPLFDVDELFRIFGPQIQVEVISHRNECKEVVLHIGEVSHPNSLLHTIIDTQSNVSQLTFDREEQTKPKSFDINQAQWLSVPDVALIKSRSVERYMKSYFPEAKYLNAGYILSEQKLDNFEGAQFKIETPESYKPKALKKRFKELNITKATLHLKGFPYPIAQIQKQLALKDGAEKNIFCFKDPTTAELKVAIATQPEK